jgi:hypothetical protein
MVRAMRSASFMAMIVQETGSKPPLAAPLPV